MPYEPAAPEVPDDASESQKQTAKLLAQPADALRMNVGGPHRQIRHVEDPPHESAYCADCEAAHNDLESPRDHCAAHDHVIRTEAP